MFNKILINKYNLINNIKQVIDRNQNSKICAMVKANAYGVGDCHVVQVLDEFVDFWGVACFFEAKRICGLTKKKILIFGALEKDFIDERFSYACSTLEDLKFLVSLNRPIKIHLKINTGMNRYGFKDLKSFKKALQIVSKSSLVVEGVFTHFATTDSFVETQMLEFKKFLSICKKFKINPIVHADNSFVNENNNHHLDMVRVGFCLYNQNSDGFLPAVEIKSEIVQINKIKSNECVGYDNRFVASTNMKVAVVPIGYADGFSINYIGTDLFVGKHKCKVLNVCMDCFMLDITKLRIKKGDEIYILNKFNHLKNYSNYSHTSEYEVMTNFSHMRADRILINGCCHELRK